MGFLTWLSETLEDRKHNKELEKKGLINKDEIRLTTVGWRPDPIHKQDGYTADPGNRENGKHKTPSKNEEYYKVIRKRGTRE